MDWLEAGSSEADGKAKLVATALALLGGSAGGGVGGGVYVYDLGVFAPIATVIKKNKASTTHDNMYPSP